MVLEADGRGYHEAVVEGVEPGARYLFRLSGGLERPDPVSRFQRNGVDGPSEVTEAEFPWTDWGWRGSPAGNGVVRPLGATGEFEAAAERLDDVAWAEATVIELPSVVQSSDGIVFPYAPRNTAGGPLALKRLIDECHARRLSVVLGVVVGMRGRSFDDFGPYSDGVASHGVRNCFIGNTLYWLDEFHIDGLRVRADASMSSFVDELNAVTDAFARRTRRHVYVMTDSESAPVG